MQYFDGLNEDAILSIRNESLKIYINPVALFIKVTNNIVQNYQKDKKKNIYI